MNKQEYIDTAEQELLHTYNRFSLVLDHGEGVYLYDTDKKAYLDFAAGIVVGRIGGGEAIRLTLHRADGFITVYTV